MNTHDYATEVGLESAEKKIKWPFAVLILAALVAAGWWGARHLGETRSHGGRPENSQPVAAPAPADHV